ncbi:CARDB domain-containing protein [Haloarchaeobius sp. TZWWS8]|uniref:CARDB domain-containing protein n=1 Tax=Haloarchaeobius sp. TZWWS8 TaxID=3446121 RepID=UPI003EBE1CF5
MYRRVALALIVLVSSFAGVAVAPASAAAAPAEAATAGAGPAGAATAVGETTHSASGATKQAESRESARSATDPPREERRANALSESSTATPASGPAAATAAEAAPGAQSTIQRTIRLHLTPNEPGKIEADVVYEIPDAVRTLEVTIQENAAVTATEAFERTGKRRYEWTGESNTATLRFTVDANETGDVERRTAAAQRMKVAQTAEENPPSEIARPGGDPGNTAEQTSNAGSDPLSVRAARTSGPAATPSQSVTTYSFVDTGDWAIVRVPQLGTSWEWVGSGSVSLDKQVVVAGEGATGGEIAYLGPMRSYETTARGQTIRLVVPRAASMRETPAAVLDSVKNASERLVIGERDPTVVMIAAPASVDWAVAGLQLGEDDAWVIDSARLASADNVWLHEYVHTRQEFKTAETGRWLVEASADYYAALIAFEQGHISFEAFERKLDRGATEPHADAVLAEPETWARGSAYLKGALVSGAIDRRIRESTDQSRTFQNVIRQLNAKREPVSNADILQAVQAMAGDDTRTVASRYTTTTATPEMWSKAVHSELFGVVPAVMQYRVPDDGLAVSGPYRAGAVAANPTLAAGETLAVNVTVENIGGRAGTYNATVHVNGQPGGSYDGRLAPEETASHTFRRTFERAGTYNLSVGQRVVTVTVAEPTPPQVTSLEAPETVAVGESFTVTATVTNDGPVPARRSVGFFLDGESVLTKEAVLQAQSEVTYTLSASFDEPGNHTIQVGDRTLTVTATGAAKEDGDDVGRSLPTPGVGGLGSVAALALVVLVGLRRR